MATQRSVPTNYDRLPPQNLDAERSVLGAMLLNNDIIGTAVEILREKPSEVFYSEAHQRIYGAMLEQFRNSAPSDVVTLMEQLNRDGALEKAGGPAYIADLSGAVPTSANVTHYAKIVLDTAILRRIISICSDIETEAYNLPSSVNLLLDKAESEIFRIAEKRQLTPIQRVGDLLEDSIKRIEDLIKHKTGITGVPTGFARLDELTSGLQPSDMVVLAARPSVGKTAFALHIAAHAAIKHDKNVLAFSIEMSKEQLTTRLLCMEGGINSKRLRSGFLAGSEFPKLTAAADKLSRAPIHIDDTPNLTILDLRSKARRHAHQKGLDLIVIDYLQLMSSPQRADNRQVEIADISRSIKGIARELNVPVLVLSQLNREADRDDVGMPKLSHLRESGAIEQDADVVMMLARPPKQEMEENANFIKLIIAKQRNGPVGDCDLVFDRDYQRFATFAEGQYAASVAPFEPPSDIEEHYDEEDEVPF